MVGLSGGAAILIGWRLLMIVIGLIGLIFYLKGRSDSFMKRDYRKAATHRRFCIAESKRVRAYIMKVVLCYPPVLPGHKPKYGLQPLGILYLARGIETA